MRIITGRARGLKLTTPKNWPVHRVLQCIDGRFPISTSILEFGTMRLNSFCAIRLFVVDTVGCAPRSH